MVKPWKELDRQVLVSTRIFNLEKRRSRSETSGTEVDFLVLDTPEWVNVAAVTPENRLVLIRQYRAGSDKIAVEIPGGACEPGEDPAAAAARELLEETGYEAESYTVLGEVRPNPAFMNNRCFTVLAMNARSTGRTDPDEDEEIEPFEMPLEDFAGLLREGHIDHALVWAAYLHMLFHGLLPPP